MSQVSLNTNAVNRTDHILRAGAEYGPRRTENAAGRAPDRVELSDAARQASAENGSGSVRLHLVQSVRERLAAGTYETDDKVAIASHEMAKALRGE